jgi:hypothetical protein
VDLLRADFAPAPLALADALTYCDMTTTPDGGVTDVSSRLAEILERYGTRASGQPLYQARNAVDS